MFTFYNMNLNTYDAGAYLHKIGISQYYRLQEMYILIRRHH